MVNNQSDGHQNYLVNTSESVSIYNLMGDNKYTLLPFSGAKVTIVCFNKTSDVIDLTAFVGITLFSQLIFEEGSVLVTLPNQQTIHILNLHPPDMSEDQFEFYKPPPVKKVDAEVAHTLSAVAAALIIIGGLVLLSMLLLRFCGNVRLFKNVKVSPKQFLFEAKYDTTGDLIEEESPEQEIGGDLDDIESRGPSSSNNDSIEESPPLSQHTINSEGEWMPKQPSIEDS